MVDGSYIVDDLHRTRNMRLAFKDGLFRGGVKAGLMTLTGGRFPGGRWGTHDDATVDVFIGKERDYPKPDGKLTFDKLSSVFISSTNHEEDQPVHLKLTDPGIPIAKNLPLYERHGFEVIGFVQPGDFPGIHPMVRQPRG